MLHILSVNDFTDDFLYSLWSDASKRKGKSNSSLKGKILTNLFYEPSTRTSSSFYSAMSSCGFQLAITSSSAVPRTHIKANQTF